MLLRLLSGVEETFFYNRRGNNLIFRQVNNGVNIGFLFVRQSVQFRFVNVRVQISLLSGAYRIKATGSSQNGAK